MADGLVSLGFQGDPFEIRKCHDHTKVDTSTVDEH